MSRETPDGDQGLGKLGSFVTDLNCRLLHFDSFLDASHTPRAEPAHPSHPSDARPSNLGIGADANLQVCPPSLRPICRSPRHVFSLRRRSGLCQARFSIQPANGRSS